jgi:hypothetical protein
MKKAAPAPAPPRKSVNAAAPSAPPPASKGSLSARPDSSAGVKRVGSASSARPVVQASGARPPSPSVDSSTSSSGMTLERRRAAMLAWGRLLARLPEMTDPQLWKKICGEGRTTAGTIDFKTDNAHRVKLAVSMSSSGVGTASVQGAVLKLTNLSFLAGSGDAVTVTSSGSDEKIALAGDIRQDWTRAESSARGSGTGGAVHAGTISVGDVTVSFTDSGKSTITFKSAGPIPSPSTPATVTVDRAGGVVSTVRITHASGATSALESRKNGAEVSAQLLDNKASFSGGVQWNGGPHCSLRLCGQGKLTCGPSIYDGAWKDGLRHGQGTFTVCGATGPVVQYAGPWNNDERHGPDGSITLYSPMCNVLVTSAWKQGELDGRATIGVAGAPTALVKQGFSGGALASSVTLYMETGHFEGQWNDPQAALAYAHSQSQSQPSFLRNDTSGVSKMFKEVGEVFAAADAAVSLGTRVTERHLTLPAARAMLAEQLTLAGRAVVALQIDAAADEREVEALSGVTKERDELKAMATRAFEAVQKKQARAESLNSDVAKARVALEAARSAEEKEMIANRAAGGSDGDGDLASQHKALLEQKTYMQGALTTAQAQLLQAKADLKAVQARLAQIVKDNKSGDDEAGKLGEKLAQLSAQRSSLQQKLADLEKDFENTILKREAAKKEQQSQLETIQKTVASVQEASGSGAAENEERRNSKAKDDLKAVEGRIAALKKAQQGTASLKDSEAALETKRQEMEKLRSKIKAATVAREQVALDVEGLAAVSDYLRQSLQRASAAIDAAEADSSKPLPGWEEAVAHSRAVSEAANQQADADAAVSEVAAENKAKEALVRKLQANLADAIAAAAAAPLSPTPPQKPRRSDELEGQVKQLLGKCDQLRRKRDNIEERISSLTKQLQDITTRQQKRADEDRAQTSSSYGGRGVPGLDVTGYSPAELKALMQKMRADMELAENLVTQRKDELQRSLEDLAAARKRRNEAQQSQPKTVDWKLKVLQEEVDAREARIASLRSDLRRIPLLEAKIEAAKESVRNMAQSSELRQNQAATMARADQEWSHTTTLARAGSIVNRQASVTHAMGRRSFSFDN